MPQPEIIIIAAVAEKNRVIGKAGKLPWHISEDLKRFKRLTLGNAVIMGRKTFESIVARLDKPLPERRNMVLTSSQTYPDFPELEVFNSIEAAFAAAANESKVFIIGGETVYARTLAHADRLELTIVSGDYEGDAFFPEYQNLLGRRFQLVTKEEGDGYRFETFITREKQ